MSSFQCFHRQLKQHLTMHKVVLCCSSPKHLISSSTLTHSFKRFLYWKLARHPDSSRGELQEECKQCNLYILLMILFKALRLLLLLGRLKQEDDGRRSLADYRVEQLMWCNFVHKSPTDGLLEVWTNNNHHRDNQQTSIFPCPSSSSSDAALPATTGPYHFMHHQRNLSSFLLLATP